MKCERCGAKGAESDQLLYFARLVPLLVLKPPLMERYLCQDCAGLANLLGVLFLGATAVVLLVGFIFLLL